jgi:hypothetical protein
MKTLIEKRCLTIFAVGIPQKSLPPLNSSTLKLLNS